MESVSRLDQLTQVDNAVLLDNEQPSKVDDNGSKTETTGRSNAATVQPCVPQESIYIPTDSSSSTKLGPFDIATPEMFTGASPLSVDLTSEVLNREPTLVNGLRSRLPCINVILAWVAFWLCGVVFGFIAMVLEFQARAKMSSGSVDDRKKAYRLRKGSCILSVVGIIVGAVIIAIVCSLVIPQQHESDFIDNPYRLSDLTRRQCDEYGFKFFQGKCYRYGDDIPCSSCLARAGVFSGGICYYNTDQCPAYRPSSDYWSELCFASRRPAVHQKCPTGDYYYDEFCYYTPVPDCNGGYFVNCNCYLKFSTNFTQNTCNNIRGWYNSHNSFVYNPEDGRYFTVGAKTCYYNSSYCYGYAINGQCYSNMTTAYTASTCKNIGGYMDTNSGYCYNDGFNCPDGLQDGDQCYASKMLVASCSSCRNMDGVLIQKYDSLEAVYCYFYDNSSYSPDELVNKCGFFTNTINGVVCERNMSTAYISSSECTWKVGGVLVLTAKAAYCYYTPNDNCAGFVYRCNCHKYRDSTLKQRACENFAGFYSYNEGACYYNSTKCNFYEFRSQCYRFRATSTFISPYPPLCEGYHEDAIYDDFNGICYYNDW